MSQCWLTYLITAPDGKSLFLSTSIYLVLQRVQVETTFAPLQCVAPVEQILLPPSKCDRKSQRVFPSKKRRKNWCGSDRLHHWTSGEIKRKIFSISIYVSELISTPILYSRLCSYIKKIDIRKCCAIWGQWSEMYFRGFIFFYYFPFSGCHKVFHICRWLDHFLLWDMWGSRFTCFIKITALKCGVLNRVDALILDVAITEMHFVDVLQKIQNYKLPWSLKPVEYINVVFL